MALKKLSLDDVLGLGLGDRILKLRIPAEPNNAPSSQTAVAIPNLSAAAVVDKPSTGPIDRTNDPSQPKRRGRPPGKTNRTKLTSEPLIEATPISSRQSTPSANLSYPQVGQIPQSNLSISGSRPGTPLGSTPPENQLSPQQTPSRGSTPASKKTRPSLGTHIRKAKFTPYEKVQRDEDDAKIKAGIPGVYINPTVSQVPVLDEVNERRPKKRIIAVFKSDKLKIPQWLAARKGTWKEAFPQTTQNEYTFIEQRVPSNAAPTAKSTPLTQKPHNGPAGVLLQPNGSIPLPVANTAGPPQQPNAQRAVNNHNPAQSLLQSGTTDVQQRGHPVDHTPNLPTALYPVAGYTMPRQSTYMSPYSTTPASTSQLGVLPVGTPTYKSPYQSPYQTINPPPVPIPQPQTFPGYYSISGATNLNTRSPQTNGIKTEASTTTPTPSTVEKGKRKREASEPDFDEPDKRHKSVPSEPTQHPSSTGSTPVVLEPPTPAVPQNSLLETILKQQEEDKAKEVEGERKLQDKLLAAKLSEVPEHLVRLPASYENAVGNLILSSDQTTLSFLSMEQLLPQNVVWTVPVSTIVRNPIVSIAGSKPMELRIKSRDDSNVDVIHRFNIGLTEEARQAADVMRAKLVLAKINIRVTAAGAPYLSGEEPDDAEIETVKPFHCEKCSKRFKNKEGILYHSTKSQTTCNPNFDPSTARPRTWVRTPKKKKVKIVEPSAEAGTTPQANRLPEEKKEDKDSQHESDSSDSLGSIIEWAEKVSRPHRRSTSSRRRRGSSNQSNQPDEVQPSVALYSNQDVSDNASDHSSGDEDGGSTEDDVYLPIEEKPPLKRKNAMQERWARVKAIGGNKLLGDADIEIQSSRSAPRIVRTPLTEEEKERRAAMAARRQQCWDTAPSFLPNNYTGAWNERPERRKIQRKHIRRYEFPEPITFMQSENGAWSVRPFGHGVKPIYARPSRRADGNPLLPIYLKRIESGFRPILMPTKNRLFFPALPTKRLLEDPTSYVPPPSVEDLGPAGNPTDRRPKARLESIDLEDEQDPDSGVRISKITGKPVRSYRRARSSGGESKNRQNLDEIHLLNSLEPKKLDRAKGKSSNPGLGSLPAGFGLGFSPVTDHGLPEAIGIQNTERLLEALPVTFSLSDILVPNVTETQPRILSDMDQVATWEQGRGSELLLSGNLQPDYRWVNHTLESLAGATDLQHVKITWDESKSFDMVTLPYAELDDIEDAALYTIPPEPQYRIPRSSLKPASRNARDLRELHRGWTTRRLTALSHDFAGLGKSPEQAARELGTQIALPESVSRARSGDGHMSDADDARLIVGVCVVRALTGGLDQNIDWVLVSTLFNNYSMNFITKRWTALFQKRRVVIEKLMADFQEAFLPAYKKGEVPPLDYDNLVAYDWNWLVDWAMKEIDVSLGSKAIELPNSRERLDKLYDIREQNLDNARQEGYFSLTYPVYKRMELASSVPNTLPITKNPAVTCADDIKIDTLTVVKSWVRAAALTPDEVWDPHTMKKMFNSLNDPQQEDKRGNDPFIKKLVQEAAEILKSEKVLIQKTKARATPDRSYEATDIFFGSLRKHVTVQQFVEASRFKYYLDQQFSHGVQCVRSDYMANEGMIMCITHLQAHGRIRLKPVGIPTNKFGLGEGSYETRKIPKEKFRFEMDIYPTAKYVYDVDNEVLNGLRGTEPPRGSAMGELPVWYGIGGHLITSLWQKVLAAFVGIISLRAGSDMEALKIIFSPTLEEWEIWRLLGWGIEHGVFERVHETVGGWTTGEWWWLVVGWCCAGAE